jgi:hypothetical protein
MATLVEVELVGADGSVHVVRRELVGGKPQLTIDDSPAVDVRSLGIPTEPALRPFLGQCEIQALIDSEQQDRWEQLSAILGFGDFGHVRGRLQRLRTDADADRRVIAVRERATRALHDLVRQGEDPLALDPEDLRKRAAHLMRLPDSAEWREIGAAATQELHDLYALNPRPAALESLVFPRTDYEAAMAALRQAVETVLAETQRHRKWHEENQQASFFGEGLRLSSTEDPRLCPFCGERTVSVERRVLLETMAGAASPPPPDSRAAVRLAVETGLIGTGPVNLDVLPSILEAVSQGPEAEALRALEKRQAALLQEQRQLIGTTEAFLGACEAAQRGATGGALVNNLAGQVVSAAAASVQEAEAIRSEVEVLRLLLEATLSRLAPAEVDRLRRLQVAETLVVEIDAVHKAWRIRRLQLGLGQLVELLESAEKRLMGAALQRLSSDIADYYEILSPGHHIKITGVKVRDGRRRQAELSALSFDRPINPVTSFSEAQGNCLGLSLYFSQRVDRNPVWRTIMLDDPVQSMDQGHEQGLIDLLAKKSSGRQIIVMTHAKQFALGFEAQFGGLESFVRYNLYHGEGPAPKVALDRGRLNELLAFVELNVGSDDMMRESCAAALRKSVECFVHDVAIRKKATLPKRLKAEERIDWARQHNLIEAIDAGTLNRVRSFANPSAHDDQTGNSARGAILANLRAIKELQAKYLVEQPQLRLVASDSA